MESTLDRTLAQLPDAPGVYMMIGDDGQILYIGKAVSLRSRVPFVLSRQRRPRIPHTVKMVERVVDVRAIVVSNEIESLILEANLIKRHQPPFNVRLRDDKRFPYLKVTNEPFPRVVFTRVVRDDGARYFGPYTNAHGLRELIDLVRIVFPLRTCREPIDGKRKRPCLQYHIKRCLAPCVGYQDEADYDVLVDEVVLFLEGHHDALIARLQNDMTDAAEHYNFEAAAPLARPASSRYGARSKRRRSCGVRASTWTSSRSRARTARPACKSSWCATASCWAQEHFILDGTLDATDAELYSEFLKQFYTARSGQLGLDAGMASDIAGSPLALRAARDQQSPVAEKTRSRHRTSGAAAIPKEILVQSSPDDGSVIELWLTEAKGQRVRILRPERGERADYLRLVQKNAEQNLKSFLAHQEAQETASSAALTELASALDLPEPPHRIECYDISNIQGTNAVSSMVVFVEGRAKKSDYRHFKIQYDKGPNDFAMMQETLAPTAALFALRRRPSAAARWGCRRRGDGSAGAQTRSLP